MAKAQKKASAKEKTALLSETLPFASQQRSKLKSELLPRTAHGGTRSIGKRKTTRPFATNVPVHVALKATRAKGTWSLLHRKNQAKITAMVYVYAARFKVRVHQFGNAGNHLHLLVQAKERKQLADFLRVLAGRVAVTVTGARKHVKRVGKFWDFLSFSRLVNWGKDFFQVREWVKTCETWDDEFQAALQLIEKDSVPIKSNSS